MRHTTRLVVVDENSLSFIIQAAAKRDNQFRKLEKKIMANAIKAVCLEFCSVLRLIK